MIGMIGTVLHDRWRILSALGRGGMGEVLLAEHLTSGRKEALKILIPQAARDPQFVSRFRREARAVNRLRHPNIVALYDFGQLPDGRFYLAMEYAEGPSVWELLKRDRVLELPLALHLLGQLAYAMHHAHSRGVRPPRSQARQPDRRSANDETLKVLDFGIAKIVAVRSRRQSGRCRRGNMVCGPREVHVARARDRRRRRPAHRSLRARLHRVRAGDRPPPFCRPSNEVIHAHLTQPPAPIPSRRRAGIPSELDQRGAALPREEARRPVPNAAELFAAMRKVPGYPPPRTEARRRFVPSTDGRPRSRTDPDGRAERWLWQPARRAAGDRARRLRDAGDRRYRRWSARSRTCATTSSRSPGSRQPRMRSSTRPRRARDRRRPRGPLRFAIGERGSPWAPAVRAAAPRRRTAECGPRGPARGAVAERLLHALDRDRRARVRSPSRAATARALAATGTPADGQRCPLGPVAAGQLRSGRLGTLACYIRR